MKVFRLAVSMVILVALLLAGLLREPRPYSETEFMMDTVVSVSAYGRGAKGATKAALSRIREIDKAFDAHDPESAVHALNGAPAHTPVAPGEEVFSLLDKALRFSQLAQGSFDITLLPVSRLWGFGTPEAAIPAQSALEEALKKTGSHALLLDHKNRTVTKLREGVMLDFGAVAKGYAADEAVRVLQEAGIQHAYLDLGGNIAVLGGKPLSPLMRMIQGTKNRPFSVGIQKPDAARGEIIEAVQISDGFIVTSGDYERCFTVDGKRYHHILHPQTGYPSASGLKSVTVISQNGAEADMLSTALFVGGKALGQELSRLYDTAIFIDENLTVEKERNETHAG